MAWLKVIPFVVTFGVTLAVVSGAVVSSGCVHNGKTYQVGEHTNTNPCSPCICEAGGQVACLAIDCAPPNCVNPTRRTGHCCQYCPDGPNCEYKGITIKAGEKHQVDGHTTCQCATGFMHLFGPHAHQAVCVHTAT